MARDHERVVVTMTDGSRFEGNVSLHGRTRVVDTFNHPEPFFNLRDVTVAGGEHVPLMILNKTQVVWIRHLAPPEDEVRETLVLRKGQEPKSVFASKEPPRA